jgi:hypothetical protein
MGVNVFFYPTTIWWVGVSKVKNMDMIKGQTLTLLLFCMVAFTACDNDSTTTSCTVPATVRDLTGLDGCGFVFELEDGTRLLPVWDGTWCGTPPLPEEVTKDPLYNFEYIDGKKVLIGYVVRNDVMTICMAGQTVKITCLNEVGPSGF